MKTLYKVIISSIMSFMLLFNYTLNAFALDLPVYKDVTAEHWAYNAIKYVTKARYFGGYKDGTFNPSGKITRAEAAKVIVSILCRETVPNRSSYSDVNTSDWFAPYVEAGKDLFPGMDKSSYFRPKDYVTREDTIYALVRSLDLTQKVKFLDVNALDTFKDFNKINPETTPYLATALQLSIISGYSDGTIKPDSPLTRAEFATLVYRAECVKKGKDVAQ